MTSRRPSGHSENDFSTNRQSNPFPKHKEIGTKYTFMAEQLYDAKICHKDLLVFNDKSQQDQIFLLKNIAGWKDLPDQSEHERKAQIIHIIFDPVTGEPNEDKERLATPLPDPPDAEAQDEAEAKALASCRPPTPPN